MSRLGKICIQFVALVLFSLFFVSVQVHAESNKTALIVERNNINQAISDQLKNKYEENSYNAFLVSLSNIGGLDAIDQMIANMSVLQSDVDQMTAVCISMLSGLVTDSTYNEILLQYLSQKTKLLGEYTQRSIVAFNEELDRIKEVIDEPTSGEIIISNLSVDITDSSNVLVFLGDKTELQSNYDFAQAVIANHLLYVPSTYLLFINAYQTINQSLLPDIGFTLEDILLYDDASVIEVEKTYTKISQALGLLILMPDKSVLSSKYNDAVKYDLSLYTLDSKTFFNVELSSILNIINDDETLQQDVDDAIVRIDGLYGSLVLKGDHTNLQIQIDELSSFNYELYTPSSVAIFNNEISRIYLLMVSENATEIIINQLEDDYLSAFDLLVLKADKSNLEIANNKSIVAYYEEKGNYTASSYQAFKTETLDYGTYLYVNNILNNDNALQSDVDILTDKVNHALSLLVEIVDNSDLKNIFLYNSNIQYELYTPNSVILFNAEMKRLDDIINGKELSQLVYDQVVIDLASATDLLVYEADKSLLIAKRDTLLLLNPINYTATSYRNLEVNLHDALVIINDANASQEKVSETIANLNLAYDLLHAKLSVVVIKAQVDSLNVDQYITLGKTTIYSYHSSDSDILVVDEFGNVIGLAYGEASVNVTLTDGTIETIQFLVKAKVSTLTLVLTILLPVVSVGLAVMLMYFKPNSLAFVKKSFHSRKKVK